MDAKLFDSGYPLKIGGNEFVASILTDKDYGDLTHYMRSVFISIANRAARDFENEDERKELLAIAMKESLTIGWGTEDGFNIISSEDGVLHLGFQMLRKRHKGLTFKQFEELARKDLPDSIQQIQSVYSALNSVKEDDSGGSSTENTKSE